MYICILAHLHAFCKRIDAFFEGNFMFYDNLIAECSRQGVKMTPILNELKISTGSIGQWKRGGNVNSDVLIRLSERLGVTTDYLLKGTRPTVEDAVYCVNENEKSLLTMYRELPISNQEFVYNAIKVAYDIVQDEKERSSKLSG